MSTDFDCIVAGAGVIGLAIGRRLAVAGLDVAVLDAEDHIGMHSSSRNSEVIHAGIYYPTDSLKARLCVAGKHALYDYCAEKDIPNERIGKLIVATTEAEIPKLERIEAQARANGVPDLCWLDADAVAEIEPNVSAVRALLSPSTGIIDSHTYMLNLVGDIETAGGSVVLRSRISGVRETSEGFEVDVDGEPAASSRMFVNSAGLWATQLARSIETGNALDVPEARYARGHYFSYAGKSPFAHLVYPVPVDGGLGIHATNDLSGAARFGPDVQWIEEPDYTFPDGLLERFAEAIRQYFPGVDAGKLQPSYTGVRPKLSKPREPAADFMIQGPQAHGVAGLVNLFGMESPGLTASLAVADHVFELLKG